MKAPLDPFSIVLDQGLRWTRDWYQWLLELAGVVTGLETEMAATLEDITELQARLVWGSTTFTAATSAAVTFGVSQPDADYAIVVDSPEDNYFWVVPADKTVSGFTLQAKNSSSATVRWVLVR